MAPAVRPEQPWSTGTESEHGDDRVVEPAEIGVPVEGLAVRSVPVLDHAERVELHVVATLQGSVDVGQRRVRERLAAAPAGAEPSLLDDVVVAEQSPGLPPDAAEQRAEEHIGATQPTATDVDPR